MTKYNIYLCKLPKSLTTILTQVDMNVENEEDGGVKVEHIDCSDAFNTP